MSVVILKECEFPGCSAEFPEHYGTVTCAAKHLMLSDSCADRLRACVVQRLVSRGVSADKIFNPADDEWRIEDAFFHADYVFHVFGVSDMDRTQIEEELRGQENECIIVLDPEISGDCECRARALLDELKASYPHVPFFLSLREAEDWLVRQL